MTSSTSSRIPRLHPRAVEPDIELFAGPHRPVRLHQLGVGLPEAAARLPITESTPLRNPFWQYSRDKIACEELLVARLPRARLPGDDRAPVAHLRQRRCRCDGGWTVIDRMRRGKPVIVHGDGTSLWTLTHARDFARGFVGLLGNPQAIGDSLPHHLRRGADLEPDLPVLAARRRRRAPGSSTSPPRRSPPPTRDWGRACSATRRTPCSSTTARSRRSSPTSRHDPVLPRRPRDRRLVRRRPRRASSSTPR